MDEAAYADYVKELDNALFASDHTDRQAMLADIGVSSIDDLFVDVPQAARLDAPLDLPRHQGEMHVERQLAALAGRNVPAGSVPFFCGVGAYKHHVPATVDHIISVPSF